MCLSILYTIVHIGTLLYTAGTCVLYTTVHIGTLPVYYCYMHTVYYCAYWYTTVTCILYTTVHIGTVLCCVH